MLSFDLCKKSLNELGINLRVTLNISFFHYTTCLTNVMGTGMWVLHNCGTNVLEAFKMTESWGVGCLDKVALREITL